MSLSTIERLIADGCFAGGVVRFRRSLRIKAEAVDAFIHAHTVPSQFPSVPGHGRNECVSRAVPSGGTTSALDEIMRLRRLQHPGDDESAGGGRA